MRGERYGLVPGPCDRLGCRIESCYGWDLCQQARKEATGEEWEKLWSELFKEDEK